MTMQPDQEVALFATDIEHAEAACGTFAAALARIDPLVFLAIPDSENLIEHYNRLAKRCFDARLGVRDSNGGSSSNNIISGGDSALVRDETPSTVHDLLQMAERATRDIGYNASSPPQGDREVAELILRARTTYQNAILLPISHYVKKYREWHDATASTEVYNQHPPHERGWLIDGLARMANAVDEAIIHVVYNTVPLAEVDTRGWFENNFYGHRVYDQLNALVKDSALPTTFVREWESSKLRRSAALITSACPLPYTIAYCETADAYVVDKTTRDFLQSTVDILVGYILASKRKYVQNTVDFCRGISRTMSAENTGIEYSVGDPRSTNTSVFITAADDPGSEGIAAPPTHLAPHFPPPPVPEETFSDAIHDADGAPRQVILDCNDLLTLQGGCSGRKIYDGSGPETLASLLKQIPASVFVADYATSGGTLVDAVSNAFKSAARAWEIFALGAAPDEDVMEISEYRAIGEEDSAVLSAEESDASNGYADDPEGTDIEMLDVEAALYNSSSSSGGGGTNDRRHRPARFTPTASHAQILKLLRQYHASLPNPESEIERAIRNFVIARVAQYVVACSAERSNAEDGDAHESVVAPDPYVVQICTGEGTGEFIRCVKQNNMGATSAYERLYWHRGSVSAIAASVVLDTLGMGQFALHARYRDSKYDHGNDEYRPGKRLRALYDILRGTVLETAKVAFDDPGNADKDERDLSVLPDCVAVMRRSTALMHLQYDLGRDAEAIVREVAAVSVH